MPDEQFTVESIRKPRWDQDDFYGRLRHNLEIIDPSSLFASRDDIDRSVNLLDAFAENRDVPTWLASQLCGADGEVFVGGDASNSNNGNSSNNNGSNDNNTEMDSADPRWTDSLVQRELWAARKLVNAAVHPDTGEVIPRPFRMSGYVPFGTPIVVAMLIPNQSAALNALWQWVNATHNACVNFCNAGDSGPSDPVQLSAAYAAACAGSIGTVTLLNRILKASSPSSSSSSSSPSSSSSSSSSSSAKVLPRKGGSGGSQRLSILASVGTILAPYIAVAAGNVANVFLMRSGEITRGIDVFDPLSGEKLGKSVAAAKKAVAETAVSRVILPAPILVLPPVLFKAIESTGALRGVGLYGRIGVNAVLCTGSFALALPFALSLFKQNSSLEIAQLEDEIRVRARADHVVFNKGL